MRLDDLRSAIVVALPLESRRVATDVLHGVVPTALVGERDGMLAVLAASPDPIGTAREVWTAVRGALQVPTLVVAGPLARSAETLGRCYDVARRCVELLQKLDTADTAVDARAYEPYLAMFGGGSQDPSGFIESTIGPVLQWDSERGTELFTTLCAFTDAGGSPTPTARAMRVHINTVSQRLDRISALLGSDWRDPEPLFRISVAARLHALAGHD